MYGPDQHGIVDQGWLSHIAQRIIRGEDVGLTEYRALRKDGSTFPAMFHSSVIFRNEKPTGLRGFIIDISERKQLEEELTMTIKGRDFIAGLPRATQVSTNEIVKAVERHL